MTYDPGKEKEAMRDGESDEDTDDTEDTTMTDESQHEPTQSIEAEINTIRGDGTLENITATHTGGNRWTVLSARNGSVDAYQVDVTGPECDCEHSEYNGENSEACAHIIHVLLHGERTVPESAYQAARVHKAVDKLRDVSGEVEALHAAMDETRVKQLSNGTGGSTDNSDDTPEPPTPEEAYEGTQRGEDMANSPDAEDKADELKAAFDEVVNDMQVQANEGLVWFQTGRDTEDTLPGPGNVQVFDALVKNPEQTEFVHDDHEHVSKKPGEWFKTCLTPSNVDEYITEVLE